MPDLIVSKQLTEELSTFSVGELTIGHDEVHDVYRMAVRGIDVGPSVEDLIGLHARIVGELVTRGIPHPRPPADMLDATTAPQPDAPVDPDPTFTTDDDTDEVATPVAEVESATKTITGKTGTYDIEIEVPLSKANIVNEEKRLVYGVVLEPDQIDAHGDFEAAPTIERAAHKFLANFNKATKLGIQHTLFKDIGIELAESYIAPEDLTFPGGATVAKGSWVMVVKVITDALWTTIKAGGITGFSIGGVATVAAPA